jgi:hypothetical protein
VSLLHMAKGQKKEAVESFLEKLSDTQRASIRAVGIDRAGPISRSSASGCPMPTSFMIASTW